MMIDDGLTITSNLTPSHIVIHDGAREVVRITMDGRVILAPGVVLNDASLAFWRWMDQLAPGMCQRVLDERAKQKKGQGQP